jgi:uncharacterized RDD family membrane protein YckC
MFCPYCGVKNNPGQAQCFVCNKKLPAGDVDSTPSQRRRSGPMRTFSAEGAITARLGDRFIAVILDTLFLSALLLVSAAAILSRWPDVTSRMSILPLAAGAAASAIALAFVYYWLLEGAFGATLGKAIVGLRVTRQNGAAPGLASSAIRNAFRILDALPFYLLGFFVAAFSRGRRRIGDYAANTIVLERTPPWGERAAVVFMWMAGIAAAVWGTWILCPTWFQLPLR